MGQSAVNLLNNDDDFIPLLPKIQAVITGNPDIYRFLRLNNIYENIILLMPTPLSHFFQSLSVAYGAYNYYSEAKTHLILQHINTLSQTELQIFLEELQDKIHQQAITNAMKCHVWDDCHALLAHTDSPFKPVFEPNTIIDCKGIKAIKEYPYVKNHFLREINNHLKLSPQERAEYLEHFSEVRPITAEDCQNANLSTVLIGQTGVFARIDLPKYFFVGFYSGFYFSDLTTAYQYFDSVGYGVDVYLFGHENQRSPLVSAYRSGNRVSLINSATDYTGTAEQIAHQLFFVQNTLPLDLKTDNNPENDIRSNPNIYDISGYVTIRNVRAGEQLLVDYGYDYWYNRSQKWINQNPAAHNNVTATPQDIDAVFMQLKQNNTLSK